jgi:hypothetical protein
MVNTDTLPLSGSFGANSVAGLWVGPMMKFPFSVAAGSWPSGISLAFT